MMVVLLGLRMVEMSESLLENSMELVLGVQRVMKLVRLKGSL